MRLRRKNKTKLFYALQAPAREIYKRDKDGNIEYMEISGEQVPIIKETIRNEYFDLTEFHANIAYSGGESEVVEYGIDVSSYSAKIVVKKGYLPIDETSLIWVEKPIVDENGMVDKSTADYFVVKIIPSLNLTSYLLQKVVK